jgi:hypothetical protein
MVHAACSPDCVQLTTRKLQPHQLLGPAQDSYKGKQGKPCDKTKVSCFTDGTGGLMEL